MEMDVFTIILKYLLLAVSMLMSTANLLLISFGVTATGSAGYRHFAYATAAVGMYLISTGFIGTFAGIRESYILSVWFIGTSALGFVLALVFLITYACMEDDIFEATKDRIKNAWDTHEETPELMKTVQNYYQCCGMESPDDYIKDDDDILPSSCCLNFDCSRDENKFDIGCFEDAVETFETRSLILTYSLIATILLLVLGAVVSYYFARKLAEQRKKDLAEIALKENDAS